MKYLKFLLLLTLFASLTASADPSVSCATVYTRNDDTDYAESLARSVFDDEANERLTLEVMRQVAEKKKNHQDTVVGWMQSIEQSQGEHPLSALEHTALLFIESSHVFDNYADPDVEKSLRHSLAVSYQKLTGNALADGADAALPMGVLERAGLRAKLFHEAVVAERAAEVSGSSQKSVLQTIQAHLNITNVLTTLVGAVSLSYEPGREVFAGLLVGLTQASLNEYLIHIGVGHAPKSAGKVFRKMGKIGKYLEEITLAHQLHHTVVSQSFRASTLTPEQIAMAEKTLRKLSQNLVLDRMRDFNPSLSDAEIRQLPEFEQKTEELIASIRTGNYGVNATRGGVIGMLATSTPYYLMNFALYAATGSHEFLVSANVTMTIMVVQSLFSHWHMHYQDDGRDLTKFGKFQQWYIDKTPVGRLAQRLHFTHHELPYKFEKTRNGDIMAGSVTDRLKGNLQSPRVRDLINMYYQGFLPELQSNMVAPP